MDKRTSAALQRWGVFALGLVPLALLGWRFAISDLTPDPVAFIEHTLGDWSLRFLILGLALTPLARLTGWGWPVRRRRMIGLFAFFYLSLHVVAYAALDLGLSWTLIAADLVKRWYVIVGFAAFVMLIPLAITSAKPVARWLGGRNWRRLHRLVYPAALLGVLHYLLLVKRDLSNPLIYGAILVVLLAVRLIPRRAATRQGGVVRAVS